jgi:hypothetical protein
MDGRCATCRWWFLAHDEQEFGLCGLIPRAPKTDPPLPLLFFTEMSAALFTAPDFGCVQWAAKEPA